MLFLTRWFGVTGSDAERDLAREQADIEEIVRTSLLMQANAAAQQQRPLRRGTHAKGVCARAQFEVFDVTVGRDPELAARLAKGIFATPGVYPAIVRFGNADPKVNSDFKPDVRSLSFSVDLTRDGTAVPDAKVDRQDFSLQNAPTLPINDSPAFAGDHEAADSIEPGCRLVVAAVQGQVESAEDAHVGRIAVAPENQAVSATALLEQRAVSSRTDRCCEVFGYTVPGQSGASPAKEQPERPAGRTDPAPQRRWQDEQLRLWSPVPRRREDDLLGQALRRQLLDRKRECRVEGSGSAFPHGRTAYPPTEIAARSRCRRSDLFRCHGTRDT